MRHINAAGLSLIKEFEGFSAEVYKDVAGKRTIGYGHLLRPDDDFESVSEAEAEQLLRVDVRKAEQAVEVLMRVPLNDNQFAALVAFTYNLGGGALQRSTLRQCINREDWAEVPHQWRRWVWAGGKRWDGLRRRREAELELFFNDSLGMH